MFILRNLEAKVFSFFLFLFLDLKSCLRAALYPLPDRMQPPGHVFEAAALSGALCTKKELIVEHGSQQTKKRNCEVKINKRSSKEKESINFFGAVGQ